MIFLHHAGCRLCFILDFGFLIRRHPLASFTPRGRIEHVDEKIDENAQARRNSTALLKDDGNVVRISAIATHYLNEAASLDLRPRIILGDLS